MKLALFLVSILFLLSCPMSAIANQQTKPAKALTVSTNKAMPAVISTNNNQKDVATSKKITLKKYSAAKAPK